MFELLVCGAILFVLWAGRSALEGVRWFYTTDTHVEDVITETFTVDGPATLDLETIAGNVTVTGGEGDEVQVTARRHLWGSDEEDARRQRRVGMTQQGNTITIREEQPELAYIFAFISRGSWVDFEIRVPRETSLVLVTSSGDLSVSAVSGTVHLQTISGDVRAEDVEGAVSVDTSSGNVTLIGLRKGGNVRVSTISGDLELHEIAADSLTVSTRSGYVQLEKSAFDNGLDVETVSGDVTATDVRATSCRLVSSSGNLTLDGCRGSLDARTISGEISASEVQEAQLVLESSNGNITFSGSLSDEGEHRVETVSGDVRLILPAESAFDLDIATISGSIQTEFAVTVTEFNDERVVGQVNGGGSLLRINTSSGNITLESN